MISLGLGSAVSLVNASVGKDHYFSSRLYTEQWQCLGGRRGGQTYTYVMMLTPNSLFLGCGLFQSFLSLESTTSFFPFHCMGPFTSPGIDTR